MKSSNPVTCTLTAEGRLRMGDGWAATLRRGNARIRSLENGVEVELKGDRALRLELRELVAVERDCCRWMNIALREHEGGAVLTVTADSDDGVAAIAVMPAFRP
jgi:hypothetical protein